MRTSPPRISAAMTRTTTSSSTPAARRRGGLHRELRCNCSVSPAQDLTVNANYQALLNKLDIVPFVDYMIINFYAGNTDWAHHNWYASVQPRRSRRPSGTSIAGTPSTCSSIHQGNDQRDRQERSGQPDLHSSAAGDESGVPLVVCRPRPQAFLQRRRDVAGQWPRAMYQARMTEVDRAIVGESVRWGDNFNDVMTAYTRDTDWFPDNPFVHPTTGYFSRRTNVVKDQLLARRALHDGRFRRYSISTAARSLRRFN